MKTLLLTNAKNKNLSIDHLTPEIKEYTAKHNLTIEKIFLMHKYQVPYVNKKLSKILRHIDESEDSYALIDNDMDIYESNFHEDLPLLTKLIKVGKLVLHSMPLKLIIKQESTKSDLFQWHILG